MTRTSKRAIGIRRYLKSALKERVHKRGEELLVEQMTHVVNYGDWLNAAGVEAYNSFVPRRGSALEVPHSFSFKLRRDLTGEELLMFQRAGERNVGPVAQTDVIVLVKTFMSDTGLQQAPLCSLPQHRAVRVVGVPRGCLPKSLPTDEQIENWLRLATELDKPTYALHQAALFLRRLARPPAVPIAMTDMAWLSQVSRPVQGVVVGPNPVYQHLPEPPWHLRVRYKRL